MLLSSFDDMPMHVRIEDRRTLRWLERTDDDRKPSDPISRGGRRRLRRNKLDRAAIAAEGPDTTAEDSLLIYFAFEAMIEAPQEIPAIAILAGDDRHVALAGV